VTPIRFQCPSCDAGLKVDAGKSGAKLRCPRCGDAVTVPAPADATADEAAVTREAPAPRPPRPRSRPQPRRPPPTEADDGGGDKPSPVRDNQAEAAALRKVRLGLLILLIAAGATIVQAIVGQISFIVFFASPSSMMWLFGNLQTVGVLFLVVMGVLVLAPMVAYVLLAFTPDRYASRAMIYAVLAVAAVEVAFLGLLGFLLTRSLGALAPGSVEAAQQAAMQAVSAMWTMFLLLIPLQLLGALQIILLPLFLKQLAKSMEDAQAEAHCDTIVKWTGISLLILVLSPMLALIPIIGLVSGLLGLVGVIIGLATQGLYMHLHLCLRGSIADHLRRLRPRRKKRKEAPPAEAGTPPKEAEA
jgi:hypothetical protein